MNVVIKRKRGRPQKNSIPKEIVYYVIRDPSSGRSNAPTKPHTDETSARTEAERLAIKERDIFHVAIVVASCIPTIDWR